MIFFGNFFNAEKKKTPESCNKICNAQNNHAATIIYNRSVRGDSVLAPGTGWDEGTRYSASFIMLPLTGLALIIFFIIQDSHK